ncbi:MAG: type IX secretion system sortase PorU [Bacteroidales bacterium]|nr:type IX secretion system sortase PorU [Bacteroidales bacterium]
MLYFEGATPDEQKGTLPRYFERYEIPVSYEKYEISVTEATYVRLSPEEIACIPTDFASSDLQISVKTIWEKKKPLMALSFIPIRKTANGYEKLVSINLSINGIGRTKGSETVRTYATHSILSSGRWYKVSTVRTGVHKVTGANLAAMGISLSGLSSNRISIFGNGGGMLSESNSDFRYDDLQEIPIEMHDGGDGIFDQDDYFLFYAIGPHSWSYNSLENQFNHSFHLYGTRAYYFINTDNGIGEKLRIPSEDNRNLTPTITTDTYTAYGFFEEDKVNFGEGGREWFGDAYNSTTSYTYTLDLPSTLVSPLRMTLRAAAASARYSNFSVSLGGMAAGSLGIAAVSGGELAATASKTFNISTSGGSTPVTLTYSKPLSSSIGYLDYIEWQADARLRAGAQVPFCFLEGIGSQQVTQFSIADMSSNMKVWDVTRIHQTKQMTGTFNGNLFTFNAPTDSLRKFVVFNDNGAYSITTEGSVVNQDLHGSSRVDFVIVTHPDFETQAERLAAFRRENDGLSVKVVTPQQIYNEFSSGTPDITAIRDYMKMIYDQTNGTQPAYLLLFGRPSYDYRGIQNSCPLYVPNYQSASPIIEDYFRACDEYFGLLDPSEGSQCVGTIDIAIGRFPVSTAAQAKIAVDKTIHYETSAILGANTPYCNYGDWKNMATFVADDEQRDHITTADSIAKYTADNYPNLNIEKIYLDAFQQVTYSSSARYPEVTTAINNRMNKGCLLFNYVGHGGKTGWAHERIIELTDITSWSNRYNQPWMTTMTCEFGWYDRAAVSPAELVFLNENGGASGMITTSRTAFTYNNHRYITNFYANLFQTDSENRTLTLGEINRRAKNAIGGAYSQINMIYVLGDPAMRLALPRLRVVTDSINGIATEEFSDTLKALSLVRISGHIEDVHGHIPNNFSGVLYPSIYDKKTTNTTLQNDPESPLFEFDVQKNILFKGNVTVTGSRFNFSFILPKDINYNYGNGKISYYANSTQTDASGSFTDVIIGGRSGADITDTHGPEIQLYMNDENFVNGGTVTPSSTLLVKLKDEYGINTTGNGIGHDLVAILDDGEQIILNNYYEAERDSFNCGAVRYPMDNLSLGSHKLKVRAWDILNNVSEGELEFVVVSDEGLTLDHVLNYPNPFTTRTAFYFEHNRPGEMLDILITIYTISGKVVRTLEASQCTQGFRSEPIYWDGRDDFGDIIGKGTYLYRIRVRDSQGQQAEKIEKLVIL